VDEKAKRDGMTDRPNFSAIAVVATSMLLQCWSTPQSFAQETYPSRTITVVNGNPTGSAPDIIARHFAEYIKQKSGQTVIVENRVGALNNIASQRVAQAKPDGYTILIGSGSSAFAINSALFKELPFNPLEDFEPIMSVATTPFAFAVADNSSINTFAELVEVLKKNKGKSKFGYPNSTSLAAVELFKQKTGIDAVGIAYKTVFDNHAALASGEIDFYVTDLTFRKGKLLALTTAEPSSVAPGVPGALEVGLRDFDLYSWFGVWVPKGTPKDVIEKLTSWINEAVRSDETREKFLKMGLLPWPGAVGEALRDFTRAEMVKWKTVVEIAKIPPP
jgi:tripartite-type tricarboxylate transporter receptor subunit TctC